MDFLEQNPSNDAYWCPKNIAEELGLNCNTVRWALKQLLNDSKAFWIPKGKVHLYASTRRFSDDFNRLMKVHPPTERYEIHGITLKITAESLGKKALTNAIPVGGVVRDGWKGVRRLSLCFHFQFPLLGIFPCIFIPVGLRRDIEPFNFQFPLLGIFPCIAEKKVKDEESGEMTFNSRYLGFFHASITAMVPDEENINAFNSRYLGFFHASVGSRVTGRCRADSFQFPLLGIFPCIE